MEGNMLEHIHLRTTNMQRLEEWYTRILGLKKGYRGMPWILPEILMKPLAWFNCAMTSFHC